MSEAMTNYVWPALKIYRDDMDEGYHLVVEPSPDFPDAHLMLRVFDYNKQVFELALSARDQAALIMALKQVRSIMSSDPDEVLA